MLPAEEHRHLAGDIDQVAYLRLGDGLHAYLAKLGFKNTQGFACRRAGSGVPVSSQAPSVCVGWNWDNRG